MIKSIPNKKELSNILFYMGILVTVISIVASQTMTHMSYDYFYMIPTGKYIVENGFIRDNIFNVNDMGIVVQQWLYCVYLYFISGFGKAGIIISSVFMFMLIIAVSYNILLQREFKNQEAFLIIVLSFVFSGSGGYLSEIRPEAVTVVLILIEIYCIERYIKTCKPLWIYFLPIIMLLEVNLHGSMWIMHYIALLPYVFPNVLNNVFKSCEFTEKHVKHMILSVFFMTLCMFINPYGYEMVVYTLNSFLSGTFNYVSIKEMTAPSIASMLGCYIMLIIIGTVILICKSKIKSVSFYAIAGYVFMAVLAYRNMYFLYFAVFYFSMEFFIALRGKEIDIDITKDAKLWHISVIYLLAIGFVIFDVFLYNQTDNFMYKNMPEKIISYLDENTEKDDVIYTGFNSGNYFEYAGYTNVYMDARPELYMKKVNGNVDVLPEYVKYGIYGYFDGYISDDEYQKYLDTYEFHYFVIDIELRLRDYLEQDDNYKLILEDNGFYLYEKIN